MPMHFQLSLLEPPFVPPAWALHSPILGTSGLDKSRVGVVLSTAAMLDDVVGLIMVRVISELGGNAAFKAVTVLRPIGISIAFLFAVLFTCRFVA